MQRRLRRAGWSSGALLLLGAGLLLLGTASSTVSETSSITAASGMFSETSSITAASGMFSETSSITAAPGMFSETSSITAAPSTVNETSSITAPGPVNDTSSITAPGPVNDTSSITAVPLRAAAQDEAQTTPTYVSELAPAVMLAPEPAVLPVSGAGADAGTPWPKATGLALALLGVLFIYGARAVRTEDTR